MRVSEEPSSLAVPTGNANAAAISTRAINDAPSSAWETLMRATFVFWRERWIDETTEHPAPIMKPSPAMT